MRMIFGAEVKNTSHSVITPSIDFTTLDIGTTFQLCMYNRTHNVMIILHTHTHTHTLADIHYLPWLITAVLYLMATILAMSGSNKIRSGLLICRMQFCVWMIILGVVQCTQSLYCLQVMCYLQLLLGLFCYMEVMTVFSLVQWFKCDDAWITKATLEEVLASEA